MTARGTTAEERINLIPQHELDLLALSHDNLFYHGTSTLGIASIAQNGLEPRRLPDRVDEAGRHLELAYLCLDPAAARGYAQRKCSQIGGEPVILGFRLPWDWVQERLYSLQMVQEHGYLAFAETIPVRFLAGGQLDETRKGQRPT